MVPAGTIKEFVTYYLDTNGRRIAIIGKLSINNSVQFLVFSDQAWGSGLPYIANLLDQVEVKLWVSSNNSNHNWGGHSNDSNSITNFAWVASI